jgi:hypothetical protein
MDANSGEEYYSNASPQPAAAPDESEDSESQSTALLPKSFFGGKELKPGAQCRIRIKQVMEDQVAVAYGGHEGSASPMMERDEEMEQMML